MKTAYETTHFFGITGRKDSGKTTLVCQLIPALKNKGLRVATIKHTHHDIEFDQPGKDSFKHRDAGADRVLIASRHRMAIFEEYEASGEAEKPERELADLIPHFNDVDLVIVEGFKHSAHPKLQVYRSATGPFQLLEDAQNVIAIATDTNLDESLIQDERQQLALTDIEAMAEFIIQHAQPLS